MVSLHADHRIHPAERFAALVADGVRLAASTDLLLTVGIPPDRPETGFGWIRAGQAVPTSLPRTLRRVEAFVEKPDRATAERYMAEGLLWNSGIFIWPVARFLEELRLHAPEVAPFLELLDRGDDEGFFQAVSPISVDEAVLERSARVATLDADFEWDDVGSWEALARSRPSDDAENVAEGRLVAVDAHRNVVWSEDGPVVLFGVDDLVVVRAEGVTVVAPRGRSADWKTLLQRLPPELANPEGDR
jgi:mannose-1-phosphate guanylyltransferase